MLNVSQRVFWNDILLNQRILKEISREKKKCDKKVIKLKNTNGAFYLFYP